jgi:hypothetical protein
MELEWAKRRTRAKEKRTRCWKSETGRTSEKGEKRESATSAKSQKARRPSEKREDEENLSFRSQVEGGGFHAKSYPVSELCSERNTLCCGEPLPLWVTS